MSAQKPPVIITFAAGSSELGERLARFTGGSFHRFDGASGAGEKLRDWFMDGVPIVGICASGILIRLLAPVIADKHGEPPVLVVSADGQHVVPLIGGHHGANALAERIATEIGATSVVTTASNSRFAFGFDEPPAGYVLADPEKAKAAMASVLRGESLRVEGEDEWLVAAGYPVADDGSVSVTVSEQSRSVDGLLYHPKTLVAGLGCARGTDKSEIVDLVERTFAENGLALQSLAALVSIDIKADEAGLLAAAAHFGVPFQTFKNVDLAAQKVPHPSTIVEKETGTPSVAEAAAMMAGELIVEKRKTANATLAISRADKPVKVEALGRAPGQLHIVGIGPGEAMQRTASAVQALTQATDWVGYGLYLDLIADLKDGQSEHRFDLGDEEARVRHALEEAGEGKCVSLVCSGDAQIYAMAALVYELLQAEGARALSDAARRVAVESHPGISAFQMASARAGALIGHDFCCISLSDLLTPRDAIERRLEAAAAGDFVTALYNPRSQRRTELIEKTKILFLAHRPADTPVILASNLGRADEQVRVETLESFDPGSIDMLTIVLIGSSASRSFQRGNGQTVTFTPRGYERKAEAAE